MKRTVKWNLVNFGSFYKKKKKKIGTKRWELSVSFEPVFRASRASRLSNCAVSAFRSSYQLSVFVDEGPRAILSCLTVPNFVEPWSQNPCLLSWYPNILRYQVSDLIWLQYRAFGYVKYLTVPFLYASAAHQARLVSPWRRRSQAKISIASPSEPDVPPKRTIYHAIRGGEWL